MDQRGLGLIHFALFAVIDPGGRWVAQHDLRAVDPSKTLEIGCAVLACAGLLLGDVYLLLCALTLLGVQSAYFGPAKFVGQRAPSPARICPR